MSTLAKRAARAVADVAQGSIFATVEIAVPPERVFRAIASKEIVAWWVRPGVFDTREWTGDVRVGGRWKSSGLFRGNPYSLEGEYLEVDPPRKLALTWERAARGASADLSAAPAAASSAPRSARSASGMAKLRASTPLPRGLLPS